MSQDLRSWKRYPIDGVAKCRLADGSAYHYVKVRDIHHLGCGLRSDVEMQKGQSLRIVVTIPPVDSAYLTGEVAWSGARENEDFYSVGVRFNIDNPNAEENSMKLYHYCNRMHAKP
jgi:hypothetical protein